MDDAGYFKDRTHWAVLDSDTPHPHAVDFCRRAFIAQVKEGAAYEGKKCPTFIVSISKNIKLSALPHKTAG